MKNHNSHPFRAGSVLAGVIGALAGAWWLRHLTARAVRAWRAGIRLAGCLRCFERRGMPAGWTAS